jgi:cytochrome c-type biogenesis protein CcmH
VTVLLLSVALLAMPPAALAEDAPSRDASAAAPLDEPPAGPPLEGDEAVRESRRIGSGLRCPVCQGLSVADSNADAAVAMKNRIDELVRQGYSEEQIVDYFVDRYGEFVRLEPEAEGLNVLLWVIPGLVLLGGGAWWWSTANRDEAKSSAPSGAVAAAQPTVDPELAPYVEAVLAEVGPAPIGGPA